MKRILLVPILFTSLAWGELPKSQQCAMKAVAFVFENLKRTGELQSPDYPNISAEVEAENAYVKWIIYYDGRIAVDVFTERGMGRAHLVTVDDVKKGKNCIPLREEPWS